MRFYFYFSFFLIWFILADHWFNSSSQLHCGERTPDSTLSTDVCGRDCFQEGMACADSCILGEYDDVKKVCKNCSEVLYNPSPSAERKCGEWCVYDVSTSTCKYSCSAFYSADASTGVCTPIFTSCDSIVDAYLCEAVSADKPMMLSCMWLSSTSFRGCVDLKNSCEIIYVKEMCVSMTECQWEEETGCIGKEKENPVQSGVDSSLLIIILVIGLLIHDLFLDFYFLFRFVNCDIFFSFFYYFFLYDNVCVYVHILIQL
jgi:hypothetical protein